MRLLITGAKGTGKTTISRLLSERTCIPLIETDKLIEKIYFQKTNEKLTYKEIFKKFGEQKFREFEIEAVLYTNNLDFCIISTGGSTLLNPQNRNVLRNNSIFILLISSFETLWERVKNSNSALIQSLQTPEEDFKKRVDLINDVLYPYADIIINTDNKSAQEITEELLEKISFEFSLLSSKFSSFGQILQIHTFGESHGPAIGAVIDGIPPNIEICEEDIQKELDRRRPGQSSITTPRNEPDKIKILSGIFEGKTTGAPIALLIENKDQKSKDYDTIKNFFRPGHADFTFWKKYSIRDHRGGGRSSGRETAARVACGAIAKKILSEKGIKIYAYSLEIAGIKANKIDLSFIEKNPVRSPDPDSWQQMQNEILKAQQEGDSVGGIIGFEIIGVPQGLGDPVFAKLDAKIASAIFSIGAVKGLEFGSGFSSASMRGSEHNDQMQDNNFLSNNAGGILGGISTGEKIYGKVAVKPTPSISKTQKTISIEGSNAEINIKGRHDPCIVPRLIPVLESMIAIVLLDSLLINDRLCASRKTIRNLKNEQQ